MKHNLPLAIKYMYNIHTECCKAIIIHTAQFVLVAIKYIIVCTEHHMNMFEL